MNTNLRIRMLILVTVASTGLLSGARLAVADDVQRIGSQSKLILNGKDNGQFQSILAHRSLMLRTSDNSDRAAEILSCTNRDDQHLQAQKSGSEIVERAKEALSSLKQLFASTFQFITVYRLFLPLCLLLMGLNMLVEKLKGR